jgi:hypothetical protein
MATVNKELQDRFLRHLRVIVETWRDEDRAPDVEDKLNGAIFSVLVLLDGGYADVPQSLLTTAEGDINDKYSDLHDLWKKYETKRYDPKG